MLKSTHKTANASSVTPLPPGWTEHKAPTGHTYYHNAASRTSTYTRPQLEQRSPPSHHRVAAQPYAFPDSHSLLPNLNGTSHRQGRASCNPHVEAHKSWSSVNFAGRHIQHQRSQSKDRPKSKHEIPGCEPWLLVKTKLGRRFVHNPRDGQSFWKFPSEVMKGVVEYDRQEREKRRKIEHEPSTAADDEDMAAAEAEYMVAEAAAPTAAPRPTLVESRKAGEQQGSDGEYEEVEVTDDDKEDDGANENRSEKAADVDQPIDFTEDDIAYQLQAMGQDYGLDPGEYDGGYDEELEEGAQGLALTEEDSKALFKDMLEDLLINPYTTWEALIEAGHIIEDDRYTILPNMRSRKDVWSEWSRNKMQYLKEQREKAERKDPKIPFFAFLQARATPKLYWPEFRRKFQKEPEMRNTKLSDKDREKYYREYINRLKLPESTLKSELVKLLKTISLHELNRSTSLEGLPAVLLTDMRFISLRTSLRDDLIEAHLASLSPAPSTVDSSPEEVRALIKEERERQRRKQAIADRQSRVQDEKRRQQGALRQSKGKLREGELEVEQAMRIGREGLLGHMETHRAATANREKSDSG